MNQANRFLSQPKAALPRCPQSWYILGPSSIRPGRVHHFDMLGRSLVWFRPLDKSPPQVLSGHCPHMGVHLKNGTVVDAGIRCPLHHWVVSKDGVVSPRCDVAFDDVPQLSKYGVVFAHVGDDPCFEAPAFLDDVQRTYLPGRPIEFSVPWYVPLVNAFDMNHLHTIHGRILTQPPKIEYLGPWTFRLTYVSRVTGRGLSNRLMAWLSGNEIRISMTCHGGTTLIAESEIGQFKTCMMMSFRPTEEGVSLFPFYGIQGTGLGRKFAVRLTRFLFNSFLRKDIQILDGIRFRADHLGPGDETLARFLEFLQGLPFNETQEVAV